METTRLAAALGLVMAGMVGAGCSDETSIDVFGPDDDGRTRTAPRFEWQGQMAYGDELEIKGVAGAIRAAPAVGAAAEVVAIRRGGRSDPAAIRIEVVRHSRGVTICAVYPAPAGRPANECRPGDGDDVNVDNNDAEAEFTVLVPAGVVFVGRAIVGDVEATGLSANAFVSSVTGNVRVETTGFATATTVTGSVQALFGTTNWDRDLAFTTVTGDVLVQVPSGTNADVTMSTLNGRIQSDFPLTDMGNGRHEGAIGSGGRELTLSTVTGNVTLRRTP